MKKTIKLSGLSCMHCVNHTKEALSEVVGVSEVEVTLNPQQAIIEADASVSDDALKSAIDELGYTVVSID